MKNTSVTKFAIGGVLVLAITLGTKQHTNDLNNEEEKKNDAVPTGSVTIVAGTSHPNEFGYFIPDGYHLEGNTIKKDIAVAAPEGFHVEESSKIVKNPKGLVDATYVPEGGYHLEQYDYDNNLFYVIQDGYHNENGYLIPDGWHLEGTTIKKDIVEVGFSRTRKLK